MKQGVFFALILCLMCFSGSLFGEGSGELFTFELGREVGGYSFIDSGNYYNVPKVDNAVNVSVYPRNEKSNYNKKEYEFSKYTYQWMVEGKMRGTGTSENETFSEDQLGSITFSCTAKAYLREKKEGAEPFIACTQDTAVTINLISATISISKDVLCEKTDVAAADTAFVKLCGVDTGLKKYFDVLPGACASYVKECEILTAESRGISYVAATYSGVELDSKFYTVFMPEIKPEKKIVCSRQFTIGEGAVEESGNNGTFVKGFNWRKDTVFIETNPEYDHQNNLIAKLLELKTKDKSHMFWVAKINGSDTTYKFEVNDHVLTHIKPGECVKEWIILVKGDETKREDFMEIVAPVDHWTTKATDPKLGPTPERAPGWWNFITTPKPTPGTPVIKADNNCLSFAVDFSPDYYYCRGASDHRISPIGPWAEISMGFAKDVLNKMKTKGHLVYYVYSTETEDLPADMHWYRLEGDGKWSHKQGISIARAGLDDPRVIHRLSAGGRIYNEDKGFCWITKDLNVGPIPKSKDEFTVSKVYPRGFNGYIGSEDGYSNYILSDWEKFLADSTYTGSDGICFDFSSISIDSGLVLGYKLNLSSIIDNNKDPGLSRCIYLMPNGFSDFVFPITGVHKNKEFRLGIECSEFEKL